MYKSYDYRIIEFAQIGLYLKESADWPVTTTVEILYFATLERRTDWVIILVKIELGRGHTLWQSVFIWILVTKPFEAAAAAY